jgi:hypothetical protein
MFPVNVNQSTPYNVAKFDWLQKNCLKNFLSFQANHDDPVSIATWPRAAQPSNRTRRCIFDRIKELSLLKASRPALGPTIQWVPPSPGVNRPGVRLTTHIHPLPRLRINVLISPLPNTSSLTAKKKQLFPSYEIEFCL